MQKSKITALLSVILLTFFVVVPTVNAVGKLFEWPHSQTARIIAQTPRFTSPGKSIQLNSTSNTISISLSSQKITPTPTSTFIFDSSPLTGIQSFIMNAINNYRKSQGLYPVQTDNNTCSFAAIRAQEITTGFNHNGFNNRVSSHTLSYPSYHFVTENLAETPNYQDVVNLWINSPAHAENMRGNTPYVCVEKDGNYYAYEGWRP